MPGKLLIIDDEDLVRNYVRRAAASRGWEVTEAANGAAALKLAAAVVFDAVVCDLKMPDMRGEEVIKAVKAAQPDTPVIVITGSVSNISSPIVPGVSVEGVLIKPFGIDEIRALLEKVAGA